MATLARGTSRVRWLSKVSIKKEGRLRPLQRPQFPHRPLALMDAAGVALQPGLGAVADVARQEVAAEKAVLRVGFSRRRHGTARTGAGVFPGLARVLFGTGEDSRRRGPGVGE